MAALAEDRARRGDAAVVLAQMHAVGLHVRGQARVVVHDERHAGGAAQRRERGGLRGAQRRIGRLVAVLQAARRMSSSGSTRATRRSVSASSGVIRYRPRLHAVSPGRALPKAARRWDNAGFDRTAFYGLR